MWAVQLIFVMRDFKLSSILPLKCSAACSSSSSSRSVPRKKSTSLSLSSSSSPASRCNQPTARHHVRHSRHAVDTRAHALDACRRSRRSRVSEAQRSHRGIRMRCLLTMMEMRLMKRFECFRSTLKSVQQSLLNSSHFGDFLPSLPARHIYIYTTRHGAHTVKKSCTASASAHK